MFIFATFSPIDDVSEPKEDLVPEEQLWLNSTYCVFLTDNPDKLRSELLDKYENFTIKVNVYNREELLRYIIDGRLARWIKKIENKI